MFEHFRAINALFFKNFEQSKNLLRAFQTKKWSVPYCINIFFFLVAQNRL